MKLHGTLWLQTRTAHTTDDMSRICCHGPCSSASAYAYMCVATGLAMMQHLFDITNHIVHSSHDKRAMQPGVRISGTPLASARMCEDVVTLS